jgi:hypothetical protein
MWQSGQRHVKKAPANLLNAQQRSPEALMSLLSDVVQRYSSRQLTKESNKLVALSGGHKIDQKMVSDC